MSSTRRVVMLSAHTSPLAQPGAGDGGGMNVYVLSLASALVHGGVECDVLTRADDVTTPSVVEVEPGLRVVSLEAGPRRPLAAGELASHLGELGSAATAYVADSRGFDAIHAHYWASGVVGHELKHAVDLPLVTTFHTLAHTKVSAGLDESAERIRREREVVRCSDRLVASTQYEAADLVADYAAEPDRIEVVPPGVDHAIFFPGDRDQARRLVELPPGPWIVFAGRIQPLKGVDVALRSLASLENERARLAVVGGPSGPDGERELGRLRHLAAELGVEERVRWVAPLPHASLADWYRAADVCVVPSRTESFGLVALEAAACGRPVVAASVGGLRSLIDDGSTGFLVEGRDPLGYIKAIDRLLAEPEFAATMGSDAAARSRAFTWSMTAARLRRLYADLGARELVRCS